MTGRTHLGDLQLAIMRVLWGRDEATVADVHRALADERGLAPTTVATMLKKMEQKGVVEHRIDGRTFVYAPTVSESEVTHSMVSQLGDRLFGGDVTAFVGHLIEEHDVDAQELAELRALIARAEKKK